MLAVIEDPWLYEQCRRQAAGARPVRLWPIKLRLSVRAAFVQFRWALRTCAGLLRQRRLSRPSPPPRFDCLLYGLPHPRCFIEPKNWTDPFMGDLWCILERNAQSLGRLVPPGTSGFEGELANQADYVLPMILEATLPGLMRSLAAFWAAGPRPILYSRHGSSVACGKGVVDRLRICPLV